MAATAVITTLAESVPKAIRCSGIAVVYALTISVFCGSAQFIIAWLTGATHSPLPPAYYWTGAAGIGLMAAILIKESARGLRRSR
jgi:hypothetical protein